MRFGISLGALVVGALAGLGCSSPNAARTRFASDFNCPVEQTESQYLGNGRYDVSGCAQRAGYTCVEHGSGVGGTAIGQRFVCIPDPPPPQQ